MVPKDAAHAIRERADFSVERIHEIEAEVRHDVIAFTTAVAEIVGPHARWFHYGLTSNDVVDTAQALLIRQASQVIAQDLAAPRRSPRTPRLGVQRHAHGRPHARRPRRAHHLRIQNRQLVFRNAAQHRALHGCRRRHARGKVLRRGRNLRAPHARTRRKDLRAPGTEGGGSFLPGHSARPPRALSRHASRDCIYAWTRSPPRSATCSAPKSAKRKSSSAKNKKGPPPCRTSAIP